MFKWLKKKKTRIVTYHGTFYLRKGDVLLVEGSMNDEQVEIFRKAISNKVGDGTKVWFMGSNCKVHGVIQTGN